MREEDVEKWATRVSTVQATNDEALAELKRASLKYASEIDGVNTTVASTEAQLRQAQYYLDNTTLTAPEDGRIINLQVRPGMVSGIHSHRRNCRLDRGGRPLRARDLLPAKPQIRAAGPAG